LAEHARQFYASGATAAAPTLASTVVLMRGARPVPAGAGSAEAKPAGEAQAREAQCDFEVYAIRRAATMAFAPRMYAFPGGRVDPRDAVTVPGWAGPAPRLWAARLGLDDATARSVVCAAVREVFEESGVLLAGPDESTVVGDVSGDEWESARARLVERDIGFAELLADWGLVLRSDLLVPWSRWVTPEFEPRRYDTYFFLARLPERQLTRQVGDEADHSVWACPAELTTSTYQMLPPTIVTLRELAAYPAMDDAMAAAGERDPAAAVMPRIELDDDGATARLRVPSVNEPPAPSGRLPPVP
jgi:8-oxo-dGTP pyrophosphatase MutT (NUDIX family)